MKNYFLLFCLLLAGCSPSPDFKTFPKIDTHVHLETLDDSFVQVVDDNSFKLLTLVTRSVSQDEIRQEFDYLLIFSHKMSKKGGKGLSQKLGELTVDRKKELFFELVSKTTLKAERRGLEVK